ncbi:hypothetical protein ONO12_26325, partial [Salmonella enterica subsp. enterica serovar Montevideo]|nr:hypothetical protein [Salmonella enterica subsp. enterica serovar Montevideo]
LPEVGKLKLPAAYVVPGDDSPGENKSQTDYWQELKEGFSVVVFFVTQRMTITLFTNNFLCEKHGTLLREKSRRLTSPDGG